MKLEQQVVSLELAQKLKELGVKQESYFWYVRDMCEDKYNLENWKGQYAEDLVNQYTYISAFTVAELGEMLKGHELETIWFEDKNQFGAFARAKMLISLIEQGIVTV